MPTPMNDDKGRAISVIGVARKVVTQTVALAATTNYAANDVLSDNASTGTYWTFSNVVKQVGGSATIKKAILVAQGTQVAFRGTLYLSNAVPTSQLNDNSANTAPAWADRAGYLGKISFPALSATGGSREAQVVPGEGGLPLPFTCGGALTDIYGILITEDAETNEVAGHSYIIIFELDHNS